jgi:hypothetical protein
MATDDDAPDVPVRCEACETSTRVPLSEVAETIERHNERLHDGEELAGVDPAVADRFADLVADDLGLTEDV